jgi:hypothetical protein
LATDKTILNTAVIYCHILTLEKEDSMVNYNSIFKPLAPNVNDIKLFTVIIYCHSMVMPPFCVINLYYLVNYSGMAVSTMAIFYTIGS